MDRVRKLSRNEDPWTRLAAYVAGRRHERGWKQADLAREAGVALTTIRHVEGGRPITGARRPTSWPRLERALGWAPGSCEAIVQGGEPTPTADRPQLSGESLPLRLRDALSRGELADYRVLDLAYGVTGIVLVRADSDVPTDEVLRAIAEMDRQHRGDPPSAVED